MMSQSSVEDTQVLSQVSAADDVAEVITSDGSPAVTTYSACGQEGQKDKRNNECPHQKTNTTCAESGSAGAGRGGAEPKKAFHQTWEKVHAQSPNILSRKEAVKAIRLDELAKEHVKQIVSKLLLELSSHNLSFETMEEIDLFLVVVGGAWSDLYDWMRIDINLRLKQICQVREWEFYSFWGMMTSLSLSRRTKSSEFSRLRSYAANMKTDCSRVVLSEARFDEILRHLRGFRPAVSASCERHNDTTDNPAKFATLDRRLSETILRVVPNRFIRITIDDRNWGTVSTSNQTNTYRKRKRHKNGVGLDAAADATFRIVLFSVMYSLGYNQVEVLKDILGKVKENMNNDVLGVEVVLDGGYPSVDLYRYCASQGFSLLCRNDKESQQGNPFVAATTLAHRPQKYEANGWSTDTQLLNFDKKFVIADNPKLGSAIFSANKSFTKGSGGKVTLHAFAIRENGDEKASHVHRFVALLPDDLVKQLRSNFVMEHYNAVRKDVAETWLWYPKVKHKKGMDQLDADEGEDSSDSEDVDGDDEISDLESLGVDEVLEDAEGDGNDLQECDDDEEFDEEDEDNDEENGVNTEGDESKEDEEDQGNEGEGEIETETNEHQQQKQDGDDDDDAIVDFDNDSDGDDLDILQIHEREFHDGLYAPECPGREFVENALQSSVIPLTSGQRCMDWFTFRTFLITGSTAQEIAAKDQKARKLLYAPSSLALKKEAPRLSPKELASMVSSSWFHVKKNVGSSANRVTGTTNEAGIVAELKRNPFVHAVFEVGLVKSRFQPGLGASADNIIIIVPPESQPQNAKDRVLAPLEIKTKVTKRTIGPPTEIRRKYGSYFKCVAGSTLWFEVVPREYRGQLLHQAAVFGSLSGVFCIGTVSEVLYTVFIHYPSTVTKTWVDAFQNVQKTCLNWAWKALEEDSTPRIPKVYDEEMTSLIKSRFPIWAALHKKRMASPSQTLRPIRVLRSLLQFYYFKGRRGVDGVDDHVQRFETLALNVDWEKKVVLGKVWDAMNNAATLWRIVKVWKSTRWEGHRHFLECCSREKTIACFAEAVGDQLIERAFSIYNNSIAQAAQSTEPSTGKKRRMPSLNAEDYERAFSIHNNFIAHERTQAAQSIEPSTGRKRRMPSLNAEDHERLKFRKGQRNLSKLANTEDGRRLRLSPGPHHPGNVENQRRCAVCKTSCRKCCEYCNVPLHVQVVKGMRITCWSKWHFNEIVD